MANVAGSLKNRAIILVFVSSGLRVATLRAITYGDLKEELEKGLDFVQIRVYGGMKKIVPNACKGHREYVTFITPEATEAIRDYLKERALKYGEISEKEPLFIPELGRLRRDKRVIKPLTNRVIQMVVKKAARKAGLEKWCNVTPHALRKTFSTWVLCSTLCDRTKLDVKTQEILMGHRLPGTQDTYYDRTKTEDLRKLYKKIEFCPRIEGKLETSEILQEISRSFDFNFTSLLESKRTELKRTLTNEEQLQLIRKTLKEIKKKLKPEIIEEISFLTKKHQSKQISTSIMRRTNSA